MALTFPFDLSAGMRWREPRLMLQEQNELSPTAGGAVQAKMLGPSLWRASMRSVPLRLDDADAQIALCRSLQGSLRSFLMFPPTRRRPLSQAGGTGALPGVTISDIRADNAAIRLTGLSAGFVMTTGDYISITTGVGGREFLQCASGGAADGTGTTPFLSVVPHVRPSVAVNNVVTLVDPQVEMRLEPGSLDDPFEGLSHRSITFTALQVVR